MGKGRLEGGKSTLTEKDEKKKGKRSSRLDWDEPGIWRRRVSGVPPTFENRSLVCEPATAWNRAGWAESGVQCQGELSFGK